MRLTHVLRHGTRRMSVLQNSFRFSDRVAIIDDKEEHTYAGLDAKASVLKDALASELKVGIFTDE